MHNNQKMEKFMQQGTKIEEKKFEGDVLAVLVVYHCI